MILSIIPAFDGSGPANLQKAIDRVHEGPSYRYEYKRKRLVYEDKLDSYVLDNITFAKLLRELPWGEIKIIQTQCLMSDALGVIMSTMMRCRQISVINNNMKLDYTYKFGQIYGAVFVLLHLMLLLAAEKVVICSNECKFHIFNIMLKNKIVKIPNISSNVWQGEVLDATQAPNIYIIGSLTKRKNVSFLLERLEKHSFNVYVIGDGPLRKTYEKRFTNVRFLGSQNWSQLPIPRNSIIASASLSEGYPLSIIEFIWAGGNALLSDIESHREMKSRYKDRINIMPAEHDFTRSQLNFIRNASLSPENASRLKLQDEKLFRDQYKRIFYD